VKVHCRTACTRVPCTGFSEARFGCSRMRGHGVAQPERVCYVWCEMLPAIKSSRETFLAPESVFLVFSLAVGTTSSLTLEPLVASEIRDPL
jgi:hypothetical protein